ncbi:DUF7282 domain-containing protein [Fodinibius salsisoli]|uniref:DUF7282 domain-containing protein n=1 Tax=Fodinibius salsisoli TaxID=2820877 RepID=A0ABT3PM45_9BACT|nr:hypothetical protein [Fodinibius salsisoli]MCW9706239.1 hypothetical protein [Fodinibius salsisoli]
MTSLSPKLSLLLMLILPLAACNDDATGPAGNQPSLTVESQGTFEGNQVVIPELAITQSGWVVIHRSNAAGTGPMVPPIIGKTKIETGTSTDVRIQLEESVANDEQLFAMLHKDTGVAGEYEFNGSNTPDQPFTVEGEIAAKSFTITQTNPELTSVPDQPNDGAFEVDVNAAEDGWLVLHQANSSGNGPGRVVGSAMVSAGTNSDVSIALNEGESVSTGETLFAMLHYDTGTKGEYEFDGQNGLDLPVVFDGNVVVKPFTIEAN